VLFTSHTFLYAFLPIALAAYYASLPVSRTTWRSATSATLTILSFVFYGWSRPDYCLLMLASSLLDYLCGRGVARARASGFRGTSFLLASLAGNLGLLAYFKYSGLAAETWNAVVDAFGAPGLRTNFVAPMLPVGISFYTFQTLSYTIDVWRGVVAPAKSAWDFFAYVTMFPQLVAGPIVRYSDVADQLRERRHTLDGFYRGVLRFQLGLAKKVLLADTLAPIADAAFAGGDAAPVALGFVDAWVGALAYAFQIYFDFSGYSDMAVGLGGMLGFRFPENFDGPYRATSITDFWRRWHVTLSTWLRDYLYVPLGGNRRGVSRTYVNLATTMLLGGLWHGAKWTFVAWGAWQGFWLIVERVAAKRAFYARAPKALQVAATFVLVVFGWVLFRSETLGAAWNHAAAMLGLRGAGSPAFDVGAGPAVAFAVAALAAWFGPTSRRLVAENRTWAVLAAQVLFAWSLIHLHWRTTAPFLYFRF